MNMNETEDDRGSALSQKAYDHLNRGEYERENIHILGGGLKTAEEHEPL